MSKKRTNLIVAVLNATMVLSALATGAYMTYTSITVSKMPVTLSVILGVISFGLMMAVLFYDGGKNA